MGMVIIAAIISGVLYRLGGAAKKGDWLDILRNTKTRDLGCPLVSLILMLMFHAHVAWWIHAAAFLFMFGACTTYYDKIFGYDNYYAHGAMIALAYFPYAIMTGAWIPLIARIIILGFTMGYLCANTENDIIEETGRGALIQLSLLIILWP